MLPWGSSKDHLSGVLYKTQVLYSNLDINGFEILKYKSKRFAQFFNYMTTFLRGKEVDIKACDNKVYFCIVVEN